MQTKTILLALGSLFPFLCHWIDAWERIEITRERGRFSTSKHVTYPSPVHHLHKNQVLTKIKHIRRSDQCLCIFLLFLCVDTSPRWMKWKSVVRIFITRDNVDHTISFSHIELKTKDAGSSFGDIIADVLRKLRESALEVWGEIFGVFLDPPGY